MITTTTNCPIEKFIEAGEQPEIVFERKKSEKWVVGAQPVRFDGTPPEYALVIDGDLVRVPLFAYRTYDSSLHKLVGFAADLAVRAVLAAPSRPLRMHLLVGSPVVELQDQVDEEDVRRFRVHLGLAFLMES